MTEARKTVFVGLYRVAGVETLPTGSVDVLTRQDTSGYFRYDLKLIDNLIEYRDRAVIEWGAGVRTWVQRAASQPKPGIEIAEQYEPRFSGFREFVRRVDDVPTLPNGWQQVLRSVKGVYLLVDVESGQQYVGSAKGADSLLGRWMNYTDGGDGGDVALKSAARDGHRTYQVSVLEVVDENTPDDTIERTSRTGRANCSHVSLASIGTDSRPHRRQATPYAPSAPRSRASLRTAGTTVLSQPGATCSQPPCARRRYARRGVRRGQPGGKGTLGLSPQGVQEGQEVDLGVTPRRSPPRPLRPTRGARSCRSSARCAGSATRADGGV